MVWELRFRAAVWARGDGDNGDSETDLARRLAFVGRYFVEEANIADKDSVWNAAKAYSAMAGA